MYENNGWISLHRKIQESEIWVKPDKWLKIWVYILLNVSHKTKNYPRGTYFFRYEWIAKETQATYNQVEKCIKWLKRAGQIATRKATQGIIISVLNYAKYQDKHFLESDTKSDSKSEMEATQKRNESDNISNNGNNEINLGAKAPQKNMYQEKVIEVDENGEEIEVKKTLTKFGKYPAMIAKYYCELVGKTSASRQLPAAKELLQLAQKDFPHNEIDQWYVEIIRRMKNLKEIYTKNGVKDWNLSKLAEKWNFKEEEIKLEVSARRIL